MTTIIAVVLGVFIGFVILCVGIFFGALMVQVGHDKIAQKSELDSHFDL